MISFILNTVAAVVAGFGVVLIAGALLVQTGVLTPETGASAVLLATPFAAAAFGRISK